MKKIFAAFKKAFSGKGFKYGGFSAIITAVVLAVIVGINLIVSALPTTYTKYDVSSIETYTLSESSITVAEQVEDEVEIFLVAQTGNENNTVYETLKRYEAVNDKIKIVLKDPAILPNFVSGYTDKALNENSVIVASGKRSRAIDYSELLVTDYSSYYSTGQVNYFNCIESEVTSAIDYVIAGDLGKVYLLSGHGEGALDATFADYVEKENIETEQISLINASKLPEDADMLMVISPKSDISSDEAKIIKDYLEEGGRLMLFTDYTGETFVNLQTLMSAYGAEWADGIVIEADENKHLTGYSYGLLPDRGSHEISSSVLAEGKYNLMSGAHGIVKAESPRSSLNVSPLLYTSEKAYLKVDAANSTTFEKEEADIEGSFMTGAVIEEDHNGINTRIVWFSSSSIILGEYDSMVSGGNSDLVLNAVNWLIGETGSNISVHAKQITSETLTVPGSAVVIWFGVLIILVPAALLASGLVIWLRRRKL